MSATLTWYSSGAGAKTGTTVATYFDDLDTLVNSKSGDSNFKWEEAGKNSAGTPYWYLLRRKDASNGRIAIICWTSSPAGNNAAILDAAPTINNVYIAWFPAGTANTLSNLTASSGTICGDDTGAVKVTPGPSIATGYAASIAHFYFDSDEGMVFCSQNPATAPCYMYGAGDLIIDSADAVYGCTFGLSGASAAQFGSTSTSPIPWATATNNAGSLNAAVRTNYGSSNRVYYCAWKPEGVWAVSAVSAADIMTDTANSKAWFVPIQLLGLVKGEGFVLKLRQLALGPGTVGALSVYNTTGPVVAARQVNNASAGGNGYPWLVNFKI
jgi:hypothetical protein